MKHLTRVHSEFTRQAAAFAQSSVLGQPEVTERIAGALGARPADRLLDLACGPGVLMPVLASRARDVVGLDFTAEVLRLAQTRTREAGIDHAAFVRAVAELVPFREATFDAAVIRLALHHFERPDSVLREVRRILCPSGRLVVLDVLTSPDEEIASLHNAIERLRDPSHTSFLAEAALRAAISAAGFDPISTTTWQTRRDFEEWARIISDDERMAALEVVLRQLARAGSATGMALEETDGALRFTYSWGLFVAGGEPAS